MRDHVGNKVTPQEFSANRSLLKTVAGYSYPDDITVFVMETPQDIPWKGSMEKIYVPPSESVGLSRSRGWG